jgi:bifunctional NMN adenylyltransferase/nudix hydrolase
VTKEFDYAVFIGRFQPAHRGHLKVIEEAYRLAHKVIILVGSSNVARSTRNPFTFEERRKVISDACWSIEDWHSNGSAVLPLPDMTYDDNGWIEQVQHLVKGVASNRIDPRICLVGLEKDNSTSYLRMFPQWEYRGIEAEIFSATTVREEFFKPGATLSHEVMLNLPDETFASLALFRDNPAFPVLMEEHEDISTYRAKYGQGPFVTVDACCTLMGHVALVERTRGPGKGLLALPGGFLEPDESLLQGAYRELHEETGLRLPVSEVLSAEHTFDDPHRSQRARLVTHAYLFDMNRWISGGGLPPLRCLDPEEDTRPRWVPLSDLRVDNMFEDHAFVVRKLLSLAKG